MLLDPCAHTPLGSSDVAASAVTHKFIYEMGLTERGNRILERPHWDRTSRKDEAWIRCWKSLLGAVVNPFVQMLDGGSESVTIVENTEVHVFTQRPDNPLGDVLGR